MNAASTPPFGIPLMWGVCLTALDVLLILLLQNKGFRYLEAFVIALVATVGVCFGVELFMAQPAMTAVLGGLLPRTEIVTNPALLFAFFINAAILILAAATFHQTGHQEVADIGDAYRLLTQLLSFAVVPLVYFTSQRRKMARSSTRRSSPRRRGRWP